MHEYALARAIVGIADEHAAGRRVERVEVSVGHLRQVVPSALRFGFEVAAAGTVAEGAELAIADVPAAGICRACGRRTQLSGFPLACQGCGGVDLEIIEGEELRVESLVLLDDHAPAEVADR